MELAYTAIFFIFIFNWFSRYNFITFVLFISTCNIIRNVRVYMVKNQINNSPNPFLQLIKWSGDTLGWIGSFCSSSSSGLSDQFGIVKWIGSKYTELNDYFLELLLISKKQTMEQLALGFNYTLTNVLALPGSAPGPIGSKSIKTTNQEIQQLNKEYEKKNSWVIPLSGLATNSSNSAKSQIIKSAIQAIKIQEQTNELSNIIKELDSNIAELDFKTKQNNRIDIYDSDDESYKKKFE